MEKEHSNAYLLAQAPALLFKIPSSVSVDHPRVFRRMSPAKFSKSFGLENASSPAGKRPPTPYHRSEPFPTDIDEETCIAQEMTSRQHLISTTSGPPPSDSGISVSLSPPPDGAPNQHGKTVFLDDKTEARKSLPKGGYLDSPPSTPLASSTGGEYSYPDPFIAKAALQTLGNLNPGHRSVDGRRRDGEATTGTPMETMASRRSSLGCFGSQANVEEYPAGSSERETQRQNDNATVIPPMTAGSARLRKKPLHRELPATKLTSALKPTIRNITGGGRSLEAPAGSHLHLEPADDMLHRKPLPQPPASRLDAHDGPGLSFPESNRERAGILAEFRRQGFSLFGLRQSLPAIIPPARSRKSSQPHHATAATLHPQSYSVRQSAETFQIPVAHFNQARQPFQQIPRAEPRAPGVPPPQTGQLPEQLSISASIPLLERSLPSSGRDDSKPRLLQPADNLGLYLKLATLPKWEKWIDPDAEMTSRWYNRPNWGSGRTHSVRNRLGSTGLSSSGHNYMAIEYISGRKRTIDRLVQSVTRSTEQHSYPKYEQVIERGAQGALEGQPERYLRSWEARRRFLDAIDNCGSPFQSPLSLPNTAGAEFHMSSRGRILAACTPYMQVRFGPRR